MGHHSDGAPHLDVRILETPRRFVRSTHEGVHVLVPVISNTLRPEIFAQRSLQQMHKQATLVLVFGERPLLGIELIQAANVDDLLQARTLGIDKAV